MSTEISVSKSTPVDLSKMESAYKMCQVLSKSDLVPKSYRQKPENVFLAYIAGQPFGWDVTMSMRSFHIIEGTPSLKPEIQLALVRQAGHSVSVKTSSVDAVVLVGKRQDTSDTAEVGYTIEDAKRAGLLGKGNWKTYPEDMLFARAVSRMCRRLFQDVLLGCAYVPEELGATVSSEGEVLAVTPVAELNATIPNVSTVQDVEETSETVVARVENSTRVNLLTETGDATSHQVKRIHALKNQISLTDEAYRNGLEKLAGVRSSKQLTEIQADSVIAALNKKAQSPTYWENQVESEVLS